ncbi:MAG: hypothetical protein AVDCRST_MAG58-777 [uncultured Rubrobacteraceae bacterium]|uniref:Uncharacterized protein n=1 Tax=uncultured Rubrobacteraceae bacterium TaxID=349277 RepID=A0A6J4QQM8_9ACTN|nr:MAG: hypothetical protein AVDCRST_MAG58-777 [uncultured Rubrobacteraceae bacterium]
MAATTPLLDFGAFRYGEVRSIQLLGTRAKLFRRWGTDPNSGTW